MRNTKVVFANELNTDVFSNDFYLAIFNHILKLKNGSIESIIDKFLISQFNIQKNLDEITEKIFDIYKKTKSKQQLT